ncbi:S-layer homology domain-containing protein [Proteiniborus sp. MB09-C3]|uniref:S-layer homology domain-containing protein n=1 Tax=Proteiniborus sp. MB09-C3 TaxID=3050072 RepID=UPI0025547103|nr:S-layer homology domain-containing protein [Proteiniborus sp. MB09-C3]WIV12238.1 S-layer homology domain-containing protein [Proteiniborus sp. MB09-C3]
MYRRTEKHLKKLSLVLALLFIFTNTVAFAQNFKDVPSNHWAKDYIDKVSKAGIITGDGAGNFNPSGNVTKVQAAIMMARMMGMDATKTAQARQTHQAFLTQQNIPTWAQDGIAVALAAGVITETEAKGFYLNNKEAVAQRVEIARWLTKAMALEEEAKKPLVVKLSFKDVDFIGAEDQRYVYMMVNKGIINPDGDAQGKFNPTSPITRDAMAKMLSIGYDYMVSNLLLNRPLNNEEVVVKTQTIMGTISSILRAPNELYVTIENKIGTKTTYIVNEKTIVKLDGSKIDYSELIEGLKFEAEITEDNKVISFSAEGINEEYEGKVRSTIQTSPQMLTIEYTKDDKSKTTERKAFYLDPNVDITLNGEEAFFRDIKDGDSIEIKVRNSKITVIKAKSKYLKLTGTIKEIKLSSSDYLLVIQDKDKETFEYPLDKNVSIYRNKSRGKVTDLRKGDDVTIEVEDGVITDIEAKIVKKEGEGSIVSILQAKKPEITILNSKGEKETYYLGLGATVRLDKERAELYDLKVGYYVDFTVEGDEIVSLYALTRQKNQIIIGNISSITTKHSLITVTVDDEDGTYAEKTIVYSGYTTFIDLYGNTVRESKLEVGDEVIIIGDYNDSFIEAKSIIIPYEK